MVQTGGQVQFLGGALAAFILGWQHHLLEQDELRLAVSLQGRAPCDGHGIGLRIVQQGGHERVPVLRSIEEVPAGLLGEEWRGVGVR